MMESIDKLREYGHDCCARIDDAIHELADRIERELAERYVALPLDADGVPINKGDKLDGYGCTILVVELRYSGVWHIVDECGNEWHNHAAFSHHQPDSWERIIADACGGTASEQILIDRCKALAKEQA